jgi:hypothetical protein
VFLGLCVEHCTAESCPAVSGKVGSLVISVLSEDIWELFSFLNATPSLLSKFKQEDWLPLE